MIGKLIAYGKDRAEALRRMEIALEEMIVEGIKTTIPFHQLALRDPRFQAGRPRHPLRRDPVRQGADSRLNRGRAGPPRRAAPAPDLRVPRGPAAHPPQLRR